MMQEKSNDVAKELFQLSWFCEEASLAESVNAVVSIDLATTESKSQSFGEKRALSTTSTRGN